MELAIELGHAVDQIRDGRAEALDQLRLLDAAVFDHVVQQRGLDGRAVEAPFGQDLGDGERMRDVGRAAARNWPRCASSEKRNASLIF